MGIQGSYRILAMASGKKKDWDKAEEYFEIATKLVVDLDSKFYMGQIYYDQARMYIDKGDKKKAKKFLKLAEEQLKSIGAGKILEEVSNALAKL